MTRQKSIPGETLVRTKIISCIGNIKRTKDIARLCGTSAPYASAVIREFKEFVGDE